MLNEPPQCKLVRSPTKLNYMDAIKFADNRTKETGHEHLFDYDPDNKESKIIDTFWEGDEKCVGRTDESKSELEGAYHTHRLPEGMTCGFSGGDIAMGIGKHNTVGCYIKDQDRFTHRRIDLRFKRNYQDKIDYVQSGIKSFSIFRISNVLEQIATHFASAAKTQSNPIAHRVLVEGGIIITEALRDSMKAVSTIEKGLLEKFKMRNEYN